MFWEYRFLKSIQKWNYTDLQNYQMDEFHSKVGFSLGFQQFYKYKNRHFCHFGRKWKNLIPQNTYKKCHVLHCFFMEFLNDYSKNTFKIRLFNCLPCKKSWNLSTISPNKNQTGAKLKGIELTLNRFPMLFLFQCTCLECLFP